MALQLGALREALIASWNLVPDEAWDKASEELAARYDSRLDPDRPQTRLDTTVDGRRVASRSISL